MNESTDTLIPERRGLSLSGIIKRFGHYEAVKVESLNIKEGELVTLVGPSGCGKTTTMRIIAGLEEPSEGEIWFGDRLVNDVSVQKRNIAMVFQNYALYPHLTAADNLQYGLKKRGVSRPEREAKVQWVAQLLRIEALLGRKPREMSGGEQQRVALGRAIIRTPSVLLLDEPLSNLDAKLRAAMRLELVKLQRAIGCTTILVTHDQLEAMTMSDRIAVMSKGRIQQFDTPDEIYSNPGNIFVAGFIGSPSMTFIEGRLYEEAGRNVFSAAGMAIEVAAETAAGMSKKANGKVVMGARHEHIAIDNTAGDLPAVVSVVENIGAERHVFVDTSAGQIVVRESADSSLRPGDRTFITFNRRKSRYFDGDSGVSLTHGNGR